MELTQEHYKRAAIAYNAYCKQTGGKSLVSGETLPAFDALNQRIKDAWAAVGIELSLQLGLEADRTIHNLTERAKFGDQCYQDRCENAYVEQTVMQKTVSEAEEAIARRCAEIAEAAYPDRKSWRIASAACRSVARDIRAEFGLTANASGSE